MFLLQERFDLSFGLLTQRLHFVLRLAPRVVFFGGDQNRVPLISGGRKDRSGLRESLLIQF